MEDTTYYKSISKYTAIRAPPPAAAIRANGLILGSNSLLNPGIT